MQTISIISLKGGVAKTTTAVNMAYTLAAVHNKKVLIIDNDKQGNTSKAFKKYDTEDKNTVARMMLERNIDVSEIIKKTDYENIDIITANMDLLEANLRTIVDTGRQQQHFSSREDLMVGKRRCRRRVNDRQRPAPATHRIHRCRGRWITHGDRQADAGEIDMPSEIREQAVIA